ncbi:MAG: DUF2933 domain-containing protein [Actinomycetota bacterium]|nr:DUF2933 domain-containing protein [Actinomycetota bacterium]
MKMCINWKVVGALALAGLAVFAVAPNLVGAALPLLVLAACPLSMLVMMRAMSGGGRCQTGSDAAAGQSRSDPADSASELARLRAEVDQLRAERAAQNKGGDGMKTTA